ncbi:MAG: thioesterase [Planctomycetes bacterium]|nr:thioesterase [Planctomycetota bacterium]
MPRIKLDLVNVLALPETHRATIPEEYLDAMGHMNVMWYTHLFSVAMGGMFQLIGLTWEFMSRNQSGSFALESHIRYLSEARCGHEITIHSRFVGRSEKRYHLIHFMVNHQKQNVAATFEVVGAYIDMKTRTMAPLPVEISTQLDRLIQEHNALNWPAPVCGVMQS